MIKEIKRNWLKIFSLFLSTSIVLIPMMAIIEKIFYYVTLFIISEITTNPAIVFYIIIGFIGFISFSLLFVFTQKNSILHTFFCFYSFNNNSHLDWVA